MDHLKTVDPATCVVLGTPCRLTNKRCLTKQLSIIARRREHKPLSVDFTNVHIVAMREVDEEFRKVTSNVDWFVSDSQVLTWAISLLGGGDHQRVYGPSFLDYFVRNADPNLRHFFLGGSQECLDALLDKIASIRPDLHIVGSHDGYFREEEQIRRYINDVNPDILWVGLGTPKQQYWIARNQNDLAAGAILAVGFAFDVNAGTKKDAPNWLGPLGLTWLYRLLCEPRRLWKRYAYYNSIFLVHFLRQLLRVRCKLELKR